MSLLFTRQTSTGGDRHNLIDILTSKGAIHSSDLTFKGEDGVNALSGHFKSRLDAVTYLESLLSIGDVEYVNGKELIDSPSSFYRIIRDSIVNSPVAPISTSIYDAPVDLIKSSYSFITSKIPSFPPPPGMSFASSLFDKAPGGPSLSPFSSSYDSTPPPVTPFIRFNTQLNTRPVNACELRIMIESIEGSSSPPSPYTLFNICLKNRLQSWRVSRYYNQFTALRSTLETSYPHIRLPPSSSMYVTDFNLLLDTMLSDVRALECHEIISFLDDDNHCMMTHSRLVLYGIRLEKAEESIRAYKEYIKNLQVINGEGMKNIKPKSNKRVDSTHIGGTSVISSTGDEGALLGRDGDRIRLTEVPINKTEPPLELMEIMSKRSVINMKEIPSNVYIDKQIDSILSLISPCRDSNELRGRIFKFTCTLIKKSLGAAAFEVGSVPLQSYLPDDDLYISAFLCAGQELKWFVKLNEIFCTICSGYDDEYTSMDEEATGEEGGSSLREISDLYDCKVEHVTFKNGPVKRLRCVINGIVVDIRANAFGELCMMSFLQEVNLLIGKGNLFKRSIILIRAWFVYESRKGTSHSIVVNFLSERSLVTMLLYIFNVHHERISTPFQALLIFLSVYNSFDWINYAVTITGPYKINNNVEDINHDEEKLLISKELIEKYRNQYLKCKDSSGSVFTTGLYNIIDPLDITCNFCEGISIKYAIKVTEILEKGSVHLKNMLTLISNNIETEIDTGMETFFELTYDRFKGGWRPDVVNNRISEGKEEEEIRDYNVMDLWKNVEYCSLLLTSDITAPALLSLTTEILSSKGPLPVGEIGKLLQESTSNPSLSAALKEQFGGLKKFIEKYPEIFVISSNHPFNPDVYLADKLSEDQRNDIKSGVNVIGAKVKKKASKTKKKGMSPSPPSGNGSISMYNAYNSIRTPGTPSLSNYKSYSPYNQQYGGGSSY